LRILDSPSPIAAKMALRWEIDLSPGRVTSPRMRWPALIRITRDSSPIILFRPLSFGSFSADCLGPSHLLSPAELIVDELPAKVDS
jgi:hypothetical protein